MSNAGFRERDRKAAVTDVMCATKELLASELEDGVLEGRFGLEVDPHGGAGHAPGAPHEPLRAP